MKNEEQPSFRKGYSVHFGEESSLVLFGLAVLSCLSESISVNLMSPLVKSKNVTNRNCYIWFSDEKNNILVTPDPVGCPDPWITPESSQNGAK